MPFIFGLELLGITYNPSIFINAFNLIRTKGTTGFIKGFAR